MAIIKFTNTFTEAKGGGAYIIDIFDTCWYLMPL